MNHRDCYHLRRRRRRHIYNCSVLNQHYSSQIQDDDENDDENVTLVSSAYCCCCMKRRRSNRRTNLFLSLISIVVCIFMTITTTTRFIQSTRRFLSNTTTTITTSTFSNWNQENDTTNNVETTIHEQQESQGQGQERSYPKWGTTIQEENSMGISFVPIYNFLVSSSRYVPLNNNDDKKNDKYYRPTIDHGILQKTMLGILPEVFYMIEPSSMSYDNILIDNKSTIKQQLLLLPSLPKVYSSNKHRQVHVERTKLIQDTNIIYKLQHTEQLMIYAIQHILHNTIVQSIVDDVSSIQKSTINVCHRTPWPYLCDSLYPYLRNSHNNTNNKTNGGFPFFAWYGDYIGCNYHNWEMVYTTTTSRTTSGTKNGTDYDNINHTQTQQIVVPRIDPILQNDIAKHNVPNTEMVSIPLYTVAADSTCNYTIPFPNFYQIRNSLSNSSEWDTIIDTNNHMIYPWYNKSYQIVWRGSFTGHIDNNQTKNPRWKMMEMIHTIESKRRRQQQQQEQQQQDAFVNMYDAKITFVPKGMSQFLPDIERDIGGSHMIDKKSKIPFQDFQNYRGIIDIDGHSWSGRFSTLLCLNSVILKVDPNYVEYFYSKRHPIHDIDDDNSMYHSPKAWKHYIPIKDDFSNLEEVSEYVLDSKNDDILQEIVHNANDWCRNNMIQSVIAKDMLYVWDRYVQLLNTNNSDWVNMYWNEHIKQEQIFMHHNHNDETVSSSSSSSFDMIELVLHDDNQLSLPVVDKGILQVTKSGD